MADGAVSAAPPRPGPSALGGDVEAVAAARALGAAIAVSEHDAGPNLRAAAEYDGIAFDVLYRSYGRDAARHGFSA